MTTNKSLFHPTVWKTSGARSNAWLLSLHLYFVKHLAVYFIEYSFSWHLWHQEVWHFPREFSCFSQVFMVTRVDDSQLPAHRLGLRPTPKHTEPFRTIHARNILSGTRASKKAVLPYMYATISRFKNLHLER